MQRQDLPLCRVAAAARLALTACDSAAPSKEAAPQAAPEPRRRPPPQLPPAPAGIPTWTGDYRPGERRAVRMLVVYSKTFYFIDKGQQRGITYDFGMELEKHLNASNKDKTRPIRVVFIPVARDQLLPALAAGVGDIATGGLTVTPERMKLVDFTAPAAENVSEIAGDRAGRDAARHGRGALRAQRVRTSLEQLLRKSRRVERATGGSRQETGRHRAGGGEPRGRGHSRDGECRPGRRHRGGQLRGGFLEADLHQHPPTAGGRATHEWAGRLGDSQGQPRAQENARCLRREESQRHDDGQHASSIVT